VIDWHNYGYTWLAVSNPNAKFLIKLYKWYEKIFGKGAYANFCVSEAMQKDLATNWGINARVLYDRAPDVFKELNLSDKMALLDKYNFGKTDNGQNAFFTQQGMSWRVDRTMWSLRST
jgi:beta-1,4-mannosyltransferase